MTPDISIIIPLLNEKESLPELTSWIREVMLKNGWKYEIIMVDDGRSTESVSAGTTASRPPSTTVSRRPPAMLS